MSSNPNATAQAHGMGTELVRPDWLPITLDEVNQLLRYYPQAEPATALTWHSPRPFSSATLADTAAERLFVKRHHHTIRDVAGLTEEHRFMAHLQAGGIAVSEVMSGWDGCTAQTIGDWTYEVYRVASGVDLYRDAISWSPYQETQHAYAAGQALARMHLAAQTYTAPPRPVRTLVSSFSIFASTAPLETLASYIASRPALAADMADRPWLEDTRRILLPFHTDLLPWLKALTPLWTHNDWHSSNLLWSSDGSDAAVATILDFGLADCTNAVYDLATAIERNIIEWLALEEDRPDLVHYDHLEALLQGYTSVRPLSPAESAALPALLPLVHAEFALSEIDYFAGVVQSRANADLAYHTYFLGHAEWFKNSSGQALLTYLAQRSALTDG